MSAVSTPVGSTWPTLARERARREAFVLGGITLLSFAALLVVLTLSEAPLTWVMLGVYAVCAAALAWRTTARYPFIAFILPGLSMYLLFVIFPTAQAFRVSLYEWSGIGEATKFVGLRNFGQALTSSVFYRALGHNLLLYATIFILQNTIALFMAVVLHTKLRFFQTYRAAIFLPGILSLIASGLMWQIILGPNIGMLSPLMQALGLGFLVRDWLGDDIATFWVLVLVQFWQWMGLPMVIYLAGLQNVPEDLTDAARIDGASEMQAFRYVTFPMLAPSFTVITGLSFIVMFRVFDIPFVIAGPAGAPNGTTDVLGLVIYRYAFGIGASVSTSLQQGYAMAVAVVMFVALVAATILQLVALRRRELNI
ncbi:MAG: sugar ABC transporter permease [Chloroflexota bacterium]|nr:sugar ABC transporter permease [Chloroflexota bacterium]